MSKQPLKRGEKVLFSIFGVFFLLAMIAYVAIETVRMRSDKPLFPQTTHFDFSEQGKQGSSIYLKANCNSCHRALRSGTSMGLSLDGIGSKRSIEWLEKFLRDPEAVYEGATVDHGLSQEAGYVSRMPPEDLRLIAVFLSELRADPGSSVAKRPPEGRSPFIDSMIGTWAPESWKEKYQDIRDKQQ